MNMAWVENCVRMGAGAFLVCMGFVSMSAVAIIAIYLIAAICKGIAGFIEQIHKGD